ncbi:MULTISPECIES: sirohydrochlorin chelatase [unclassified Nocardia]|uniref:sirohydrochlorin chelatase n=1 Tax=unclassified Nocardia TaxID=2637762 RepID=UPI0033BA4826
MTSVLAPLRGAAVAPRGGREPALILVAHGSRDPRSAANAAAVRDLVAAQRPDLTVRLAFLDLNAPSVDQVVDAVAAEGCTRAIVVPMLLGSAFHARVDLPGLLDAARRRHPLLQLDQADVLGPDPRLITALCDRIAEAVPTGAGRIGIAVAAVGSSRAGANERTAEVAVEVARRTGLRAEICFATSEPTVREAAERLRARGAERLVVAPWFLAPGLLTDRLRTAAPEFVHVPALGTHPLLAAVVWDRYDVAVGAEWELTA